MTMIQTYLNPYKPQAQDAPYGWCALTHLTEKARKIQNVALRILSLVLAAFFDATIGFGIAVTLSYNSAALLYNGLGKIIQLYKKYRGMEESPWNKTALKTWAFIGSSSLLFAALYYFGAFGSLKHWIGPSQSLPPTNSSSETSSTLPSASELLPRTDNPLSEVEKNRFSSFSFMACLGATVLVVGIDYLDDLLSKVHSNKQTSGPSAAPSVPNGNAPFVAYGETVDETLLRQKQREAALLSVGREKTN